MRRGAAGRGGMPWREVGGSVGGRGAAPDRTRHEDVVGDAFWAVCVRLSWKGFGARGCDCRGCVARLIWQVVRVAVLCSMQMEFMLETGVGDARCSILTTVPGFKLVLLLPV